MSAHMLRAQVEALLDELSGGPVWIWDVGLSMLLDHVVMEEEGA